MILVTGATGFLGHNLIPSLLEAGYQVRALVRPRSDTGFLQHSGVELAHAADISDEAAVRQACQDCRVVIHAAGRFRFWGDLPTFWQTNVAGTAAVLNSALAAGVQRLIYVSSVVVVGKPIPGRVIDEDHPCHPQDFYQRTKLEAEWLVKRFRDVHGLPALILRPGAYYGPWGRYGFNRLFFEEPLRGWRIRIHRGRQITFPAFVPDVATAIVAAIEAGRPGQIYNISGQSMDHNTVNTIISDLAGIGRWRLDIPAPAVVTLARLWTALSRFTRKEPFYPINMKPYVFQDWVVSSEKARTELGFIPTPFAKGAHRTLEWYWQQAIL